MLTPRLVGIATALIGAAPRCVYDVPGFTPDQTIEYKQTVDGSGNPVGLGPHLLYDS